MELKLEPTNMPISVGWTQAINVHTRNTALKFMLDCVIRTTFYREADLIKTLGQLVNEGLDAYEILELQRATELAKDREESDYHNDPDADHLAAATLQEWLTWFNRLEVICKEALERQHATTKSPVDLDEARPNPNPAQNRGSLYTLIHAGAYVHNRYLMDIDARWNGWVPMRDLQAYGQAQELEDETAWLFNNLLQSNDAELKKKAKYLSDVSASLLFPWEEE